MFETTVPRPIFDTHLYAFSKPSSKKNTKRVERANLFLSYFLTKILDNIKNMD